MNDLLALLDNMNSPQLAMALVFIAGYGLALGGLFEGWARAWSAVLASGGAVGFVSLAVDRVPAFLLVVLALGLVAALIALVWGITVMTGLSRTAAPTGDAGATGVAMPDWMAAPTLATRVPVSTGSPVR
jgi:hypothetical protein